MADASVAARREARRKRILENSEDRMQRIFGMCKPSTVEEQSKSFESLSKSKVDNGFTSTENYSKTDNKEPQKKRKNDLEEENSSRKSFLKTMSEYSEPDNHFMFKHEDEQYCSKDCDNFNFKTTTHLFKQIPCKKRQWSWLTIVFFSPLSCILLAVFMNILLLVDVDLSLYNGIVLPCIVTAITRLCLGNKSEESQENNILMTALILCNIKPKIIKNFQKVLTTCSAIPRDFALYLTSFVLFNWITSFLWTGSNFLQFY